MSVTIVLTPQMFDAMPTELIQQIYEVVKKVQSSPGYIPAAVPVWPAPGFVAVADAKPDVKAKRVLSEEHLAKMKAGRAAKKAEKAAAAAMAAPTPAAAMKTKTA